MANVPAIISSGHIPAYLMSEIPASFINQLVPPNRRWVYMGWNVTAQTNWTSLCRDESFVFGESHLFTGCLLYQNITIDLLGKKSRNSDDGIIEIGDVNATWEINLARGFRSTRDAAAETIRIHQQLLRSCMPELCSQSSYCIASAKCTPENLVFEDKVRGINRTSSRGVAECWLYACQAEDRSPNPDIAGIGILLTFTLQTVIAVFGSLTLGLLGLYRSRVNKAKKAYTAVEAENTQVSGSTDIRRRSDDQMEILIKVLTDFHLSQCAFSIAFQIAGLIILTNDPPSFNDMYYLFLVSVDGLIPVLVMFYTLMVFGKKSWGIISISLICMILATGMGTRTSRHFSAAKHTSQPDATLCPTFHYDGPSICGGYYDKNPKEFQDLDLVGYFRPLSIILDLIALSLVFWKVFAWSGSLEGYKNKTVTGSSLTRPQKSTRNQLRWISTRVIKIFLHTLAIVSVLGCVAIETYFFKMIYEDRYGTTYSDTWSFGQIVGLTTWLAVLVELIYLEWAGLVKGLELFLPKGIKIHITSTSPESEPKSASPQDADGTLVANMSDEAGSSMEMTSATRRQ